MKKRLLMKLSPYQIFGYEEVIFGAKNRFTTLTCNSFGSIVFKMRAEDFIKKV